MTPEPITALLEKAIAAREQLFDARHKTAFRLFNGFLEGCPNLVVDIYAATLVLHNYADPPDRGIDLVHTAQVFLQTRLPWLRAGIRKTRNGTSANEKRGEVLFGDAIDRRIQEHGVWYAIDLCMNRDAGFYLDTRNLRYWALQHLQDKSVLNAFAYTGSLGVAAQAGGAARVIHLDRNRSFLNVAKTSYTLNGFPIRKQDFVAGDFWERVSRFKQAGMRFDCVLLDPPFFAVAPTGVVDLVNHNARLINKVRPLINDGGYLVAINNALYVSGQAYMDTLDALCNAYLQVVELIPVPDDFTGYSQTWVHAPITDPSPFNHSTKIAVLKVRRREEASRHSEANL
ncbi:MAG: class I SAM-dependent methyltransferase [Anaerolineae bacterium]|nr:class I SAM-dependent methyltransferase [Anaerolineae bacterium]